MPPPVLLLSGLYLHANGGVGGPIDTTTEKSGILPLICSPSPIINHMYMYTNSYNVLAVYVA